MPTSTKNNVLLIESQFLECYLQNMRGNRSYIFDIIFKLEVTNEMQIKGYEPIVHPYIFKETTGKFGFRQYLIISVKSIITVVMLSFINERLLCFKFHYTLFYVT